MMDGIEWLVEALIQQFAFSVLLNSLVPTLEYS